MNRYPNNPMALFTYKREEKDKVLESGIYKLHFLPGPAIIMPFSVMDNIMAEYANYPNFRDDDWFYSWFCHRNNIKMLGVVPNLVTLDLKFESTLNNTVLKRYLNKIYTFEKVDIKTLKDKTDKYGDKYINLSDNEFNCINNDCCRRSNSD